MSRHNNNPRMINILFQRVFPSQLIFIQFLLKLRMVSANVIFQNNFHICWNVIPPNLQKAYKSAKSKAIHM